jgi:hypothetical protein
VPDTDLEARFAAKYPGESPTIEALLAGPAMREKVGRGSVENLETLRRIASMGLGRVVRGRRSVKSQDDALALAREFVEFGAKAALLTGSQRGGDFLNNQLRGQWAERVVLGMSLRGLYLVPFGPSGAAMPGAADHRRVVMAFREILLLEGKRPDLLAFDEGVWALLSADDRRAVGEWPDRRLEAADRRIVRQARCGVEVKNSVWHYGDRRRAGRGPLSVTVKEEEIADIQRWSDETGKPVVFAQVMFDEAYCMSFRRMLEAIKRGHLYAPGDCSRERQRKSDKDCHNLLLDGFRHRFARVAFPADSVAKIERLADGSVVPFIDFRPAEAADVDSEVFWREVRYGGLPPEAVGRPQPLDLGQVAARLEEPDRLGP